LATSKITNAFGQFYYGRKGAVK